MNCNGIVVIAEHLRGELVDITLEMLACGRRLADAAGCGLDCLILTDRSETFKGLPMAADGVTIVTDSGLAEFNPDTYMAVLHPLLTEAAPRLVLVGNTSTGMDLASPLSMTLEAQIVGSCTALDLEMEAFVATSQLYGGKIIATSEFTTKRGVALLMAGNYPREEGMRDQMPDVQVREAPAPLETPRVVFRKFIEPEGEDVDLTKCPTLVAAGRGVEDEDTLEELNELAELLGGAVCATRPIVDQEMLPRSRQVGRSGVMVKPRFFLALGISGAPEHVEGMKDSDLIVAINTDETAPVFDVAHYGAVMDLEDLVPELIDKLQEG